MPSPYAFECNGEVLFDPHPGTQLQAVQAISARVMRGEGPSKFFLRGNRGGGKSFAMRWTLHALAMAIPGFKYAVVRRNMPDLHVNHLQFLGKEMRKLGGSFHETRHETKYENGSLGFYRQCEDEKDVEKVVGAEVWALFVDEAPQIKWDYLRTMSPSLRIAKVDGVQKFWPVEIYGGNPIGESIDELDRYFVDQDVDLDADPTYNKADWRHVPMHRADNPALDEAEYLKQFAGLPAHYRKAWVDGVRMDSRTIFRVQAEKDGQPYHYIQELPMIAGVPLLKVPWIQVYRAFDMGFFPDPAICLWFAVIGRRVIAFHEETWFETIAKDLATKIVETTAELTPATVVMTYADPQIDIKTGADAVTIRDILEMGGVPIECSINDRILYADAIHGLLGEEVEPGVPRFQVYEPGCPMLAKYLPKMRWDEKNPRKMADHKFDHWPIGTAYFAISSGVLSNTHQETHQPRPVWMDWLDEAPKRGRRTA
jgi:phage terminase large subunit